MRKIILLMVTSIILSLNLSFVSAAEWNVVSKTEVAAKKGVLIGNYYFQVDEEKDENYKCGLHYSVDGENFIQLDGIRTNSYPKYSKGLYFVIDISDENVPENRRQPGFSNNPSYILDEQLNIINTFTGTGYVRYCGYFNGFHYLSFTYYSQGNSRPWESVSSGVYKKTADGTEISDVDRKTEDLSFVNGISLGDNGIVKLMYSDTVNEHEVLFLSETKYKILREKPECAGVSRVMEGKLARISYEVGERTETVNLGGEYNERNIKYAVMKRYLTEDGISGVEMPEDIGNYRFELNGNLYFDKDDENYYYISESEIKDKTKVVYNNQILSFETPPVTESDRTLVPMRFLFEQMGAEVEWDSETQTATVTKGGDIISFAIDSHSANVNNSIKAMDVPARLINDKTMIPLRFLSEELGYTVDWNEENKLAVISE